ncbi:MAG: hypothetical protein JTT11_05870 [Candidatus Brockarchaeota archaeon]|nr:hypothetical protein [Candidatus Brockarchaeota archaeon]
MRTKIKLLRFTPVIKLTDKKSWLWNDVSLPWIVVRLSELIKNKALRERVSSIGFHDFLGFDGKILLSTVMEDELLDNYASRDYIRIIKDTQPDATMTPDSYTYLDDPLCLSWQQTMKQVKLASAFTELDIPVIGLIKGAISKQIEWSTKKAIELGCQSFAIPSRELAKLKLLDGVAATVTKVLKERKIDTQVLLYGLSYPFRRRDKTFVYSGLSWFISANKGYYYKGMNTCFITDTSVRFEECHCSACKGRMAYALKDDEKSLALHNLLQTIERFI